MYFSSRDPAKFFEHAKKFIEHLKKQIECQSTTTNDQNNPYRIQLGELCRDVVEEKSLELNLDDQRRYRLLAIDVLSSIKAIPVQLNEFVCRHGLLCSSASIELVRSS